jgi:hypothetical protein
VVLEGLVIIPQEKNPKSRNLLVSKDTGIVAPEKVVKQHWCCFFFKFFPDSGGTG